MESSMLQVDYSQWQRKNASSPVEGTPSSRKSPDNRAAVGFGKFSVGSGSLSRIGSACSLSKCQHPWNNFRAMEAAREARERKRARMKEINVRIRVQEKTLADFKRREAELITENMDLFHVIEGSEQHVAEKADKALHQYQKSRDGVQVMRLRFERQRRELAAEVAETQRKLDASIAGLKADVAKVTQQVRDIYEELALLNNYKDKVYPERLVLIHQLKQRLAAEHLNNEEEESELLQIIQAEHRKLLDGDSESMAATKARVAEAALSELHPSQVAMAAENNKLRGDVAFHEEMNSRLQLEISQLEASIGQLRADPESSVPHSMFPSIFRQQQKCAPDEDVVLDIPTRRLPVI